MKKWNGKNAAKILLYLVLYMAGTVITCVLGAIHPIMFVCYQIIAGILLSGVVIKAFDTVKGPGVAAILALGIILIFFLIKDASTWHCIPLIIIGLAAEIIRKVSKYSWGGDLIATVVMTFSTFGFYGQIWLNRAFTYEAAVEEMPAGYADGLMAVSPGWSLPLVLIIGILVSVAVSNLTARLFHLDTDF
ncbi:MAG: MptD family putative ECF transporter S component [Eubacterium sp.]|nr:MptD family putative ECF transporter S component [Eubacterium sp.]